MIQVQDEIESAASQGNVEYLDKLLEPVTDISCLVNTHQQTILHTAVLHQQTAVVNYLLKRCRREGNRHKLAHYVDFFDSTPFQCAVKLGCLEIVCAIVEHDPQVLSQHTSTFGETVIHIAVSCNHVHVLEYLLTKCSPELLLIRNTSPRYTPLCCAVKMNSLVMVKLLTQHCPNAIDVDDQFSKTPILHAAASSYEVLNYFLNSYPETIDHTDGFKRNILCYVKDVEIAKMLLQRKPELINNKNVNQRNVLHSSCFNENINVIRFFIASKPSLLFEMDHNGESPLRYASFSDSSNVVNTILEHKPDIVEIDANNNTTLHMAVKGGDINIITRVFRTNISLLQSMNQYSQTPMHLAIRFKNAQVIKLFQPHLSWDTAIELHDICLKEAQHDLYKVCLEYSSCALYESLLPPLVRIVYEYAGVLVTPHLLKH